MGSFRKTTFFVLRPNGFVSQNALFSRPEQMALFRKMPFFRPGEGKSLGELACVLDQVR